MHPTRGRSTSPPWSAAIHRRCGKDGLGGNKLQNSLLDSALHKGSDALP